VLFVATTIAFCILLFQNLVLLAIRFDLLMVETKQLQIDSYNHVATKISSLHPIVLYYLQNK
jgi:hypothetical protein